MAVAASHNGGKSQINLSFPQTGGLYPFINMMKAGQEWTLVNNSGPPPANELDANGYPNSATGSAVWTNGGVYTTLFIPLEASRPGNWVIKWTGDGTVYTSFSKTIVSGSLSGVDGRCEITVTAAESARPGSRAINIGISGRGASDYIRSLAFYHIDDEDAFNAGEVFNPVFMQKLAEGPFGVIRFLDWQGLYSGANTANQSSWAQRKPVDYVYWFGSEYRSSLYAGTTTNVGNDYSVSFPGFVLEDKATIHVKFNASATAEPITLNVNGTGAITVKPSNSGTFWSTLWPVSGKTGTAVYDADLNRWLLEGGGSGQSGLVNGVPPEIMVRLCAEAGAHPWFVQPYLTSDPITDYMGSLAQMVKDYCEANGVTWMVPRYEGPNETWNAKFYAYSYGTNKAVARWGAGSSLHNWYGMVLSDMGQAVSAVYGNDRTKYHVVCGVQTATGTAASSSNDRLNSSLYVAEGGSPAKNWVTQVAIANYFNWTYTAAEEQTAADAYAAADAAGKAAIVSDYVESTALDVANSFGLVQFKSRLDGWKAWAAGFGLGLTAYEGGWSPDYGTGNANKDALRKASKSVDAVTYYTILNYQICLDAGVDFPSCFEMAGTSGWAALDPDIYTDSPTWRALLLFNAGKRRFRVT